MKNIHILLANKPSRLVKNLQYNTFWLRTDYIDREIQRGVEKLQYQNIYITNDEIVTEYLTGLYFIDIDTGRNDIFSPIYINKETIAAGKFHTYMNNGSMCKKIIMTTDPQLIANGVQAIDDEFLEWFVKNPSCEEVETYSLGIENSDTGESGHYKYEIIIPKGEPKQECSWSDIEEGCVNDECECERKEILSQAKHRALKQETTLEEAAFNFTAGKPVKEVYSRMDFVKGAKFGAKWQQERSYSEEDLRTAFGVGMKFMIDNRVNFEQWFEQFKKK